MPGGRKTVKILRCIGVLLLATAAVAALPVGALSASPQPSFFNTTEVQSDDLKAFTKWLGALERFSQARKSNAPVKCYPGPGQMQICGNNDWIEFLKSVKDLNKLDQLRQVNERMNKATYVQDKSNWGQNDYWATPQEFMARFGDCEDYAIMKYLSLRMLGWDDNDLRVVAVKDLNLKVGHAILVVYMTAKSGERIPLVLDNQIGTVVKASSIRHYQPVFSINQKSWWRHLG
tara:strand:+ start:3131 stop:3826 length:696 start_codon:yes stop_codon:yes gene_type:complete